MAKSGNGEGSIYTDERGRLLVAVTVGGRKVRRVAKNKTEARRMLREMVGNVERGVPLGQGNLTAGAVLQQWRDTVLPALGLAPPTVVVYEWALTMLTADIGTRPLVKLTPEHIEAAFARRADGGMSRASLIKVRSVLGKVLAWAERRALVSRNVARIVDLPATARRTEPGRALDVDQARTLLAAIQGHRLEACWTTMLMMGLRPGEATGLYWQDIDLAAGVIHVRRSRKLHHGELVVTEALKTSRARRSLDAPPQVVAALRAHRVRQAADRLKAGPLWSTAHGDLVITTATGTPWSAENLRRELAAVTLAAGLGRWHPHELRHSAASLLSAAGVSLEQVADVLGHDGTRMTALVYRHAVIPSVPAAARLGAVLGD